MKVNQTKHKTESKQKTMPNQIQVKDPMKTKPKTYAELRLIKKAKQRYSQLTFIFNTDEWVKTKLPHFSNQTTKKKHQIKLNYVMFITNTNTYNGASLITLEVLTDSHLKIKKGLNAKFVL